MRRKHDQQMRSELKSQSFFEFINSPVRTTSSNELNSLKKFRCLTTEVIEISNC